MVIKNLSGLDIEIILAEYVLRTINLLIFKRKNIMQAEEILHRIAKPFILSGIYKDEKTALTDMTLDYVRRKIEQYDNIIIMLKTKYGCDFDQFTERIKNNASGETEDDWMEWKGANEMRQAWKNADKMIIRNE